MKDKIIYIGGFEMPDKNAAAHYVLNNARIFRELNYDVVFLGIDQDMKWGEQRTEKLQEGFLSLPQPYPKNAKQWMSYLTDFKHIRYAIENQQNVKYVIAYNLHAVPLNKLISYCKKRHIKVISNLTEWYENKFSFRPIEFVKWLDTIVTMKWIQRKSDGIIAVSNLLANYYKKFVSNIIIIPPLIDINEDVWKYSQPHYTSDVVEFVYAGGIEKGGKKDKLTPLIKIFHRHKDKKFKFSIVGLTKERLLSEYPEMENLINQLGEKIQFYGRVSHAESINHLKSADFTLFIRDKTRKNDAGFPTKFVEGWTSGINIIGSNVSNIKDYFPKEGNSILLEDNEEETIDSAISFALALTPENLAKSRRDGFVNNPFFYKEWIETTNAFLNKIDNI